MDDQRESEPAAKKLNPILIRQMRERRGELEDEISRCETGIAQCEFDLGNFKSAEESIRLSRLLGDLRGQMATLTEEWEQIEMALEEPARQP